MIDLVAKTHLTGRRSCEGRRSRQVVLNEFSVPVVGAVRTAYVRKEPVTRPFFDVRAVGTVPALGAEVDRRPLFAVPNTQVRAGSSAWGPPDLEIESAPCTVLQVRATRAGKQAGTGLTTKPEDKSLSEADLTPASNTK
jgi:hypothetical protein